MALERPESGWVWLHVPRKEAVVVVACSDICTWWAHFTKVPGQKSARGIRCLAADGRTCSWCDAQVGRRARYVFAVRTDDQVRLVELGRVQFPTLSLMYEGGRWIGSRMELRREWDAANARIAVIPRGREVLSEEVVVEISDYVASLGAAEARMFRAPGAPADPNPSKTVPSGTLSSEGPTPGGERNRWADRPK